MQEGTRLVESMKSQGDESLKQGDRYDALWKYAHAIKLSKELNLTSELAILYRRSAKACLKLKHHADAIEHASNCIEHDPKSDMVNMCSLHIFSLFILIPALVRSWYEQYI